MSRKIDERTLRMMEDFMRLHDEGHTIPKIAEQFGLSGQTVRNHLPEIAKKYGVTRDSLLSEVHSTPAAYERRFELVVEVDLTSFEESFKSTMDSFNAVHNSIINCIEGQEFIATKIKEEEDSWKR